MRVIKTAGKTQIRIKRSEWETIGFQKGWMKKASGQISMLVNGIQRGTINDNELASLTSLLYSASKMGNNIDPSDLEAILTLSQMNEAQTTNPGVIEAIATAKQIAAQWNNVQASNKKTHKKAEEDAGKDMSKPCTCRECGCETTYGQCCSEAGVMKGCPKCGSKNVH